MNSVDYASTRQGMWSKSNVRSILPTQAFLGAFDQASDKSISGASFPIRIVEFRTEAKLGYWFQPRNGKYSKCNIDRINAGVGQKLSVKSRLEATIKSTDEFIVLFCTRDE